MSIRLRLCVMLSIYTFILLSMNMLLLYLFDPNQGIHIHMMMISSVIMLAVLMLCYPITKWMMQFIRGRSGGTAMSEHLESIINGTGDAIHVTDLEGRVIRVNSAFEHLYGWQASEVIGIKLDSYHATEGEESSSWCKERAAEQGRPYIISETVRLRKDGSTIHVSVSESPMYNEDGSIIAYITISRDMTEHNKMQDMLRRSEKLTMVGQLAAGVAHEIRNPLTTLRGFLQIQQSMRVVNDRHMDIMLSELDRINLIVSEFLILAKPQAVHFEIKDVRYTLGDVISFLDSEAHLHNIEFVSNFPAASVLVHCEENQLKQVFINVLKNAMEAMPNGGIIRLVMEVMAEERVAIHIIDQGEGIPEERIKRLGEPFYTNKEKGTGLGLMVSQRIIEAHNGTLEYESELGKGTIVTILLPHAADYAMELQEADQSEGA